VLVAAAAGSSIPFSARDWVIGRSPDMIARIFERFIRQSQTPSRWAANSS
jgi:hypothetical protein